MARAILRSIAVSAAKGEHRAQALFTTLLATTERENRELQNSFLETAIEYKVDWERELERRKRLGLTDLPEPLPHPDDIVIDMKTGKVRMKGPMTKEEKAQWDTFRERKVECDHTIAELETELDGATDPKYRQVLLDEIAHERKIKTIIARVIPD
jgi:hypothetical protein